MSGQANVAQSMALQENVLWRESAQKVEDLGFHFKYIMDAISRIVAVSGHYDITDSAIIDQIYLIKDERNLSEEEIKRPRADTKKNKTKDPEELRRENQEMRRMMICKSCNISRATCVNRNIKCRHLLCSSCCDVLTTCKKCREMITATAPVKFADE